MLAIFEINEDYDNNDSKGKIFLPIEKGVISFDYISSYRIPDQYAYIVLYTDGNRVFGKGFAAKDQYLEAWYGFESDLGSGLDERIKKLDYINYLSLHHDEDSGQIELIVDGDDQALYVYSPTVMFEILDKYTPPKGIGLKAFKNFYNMTLSFDQAPADEVYYKPINMHDISCKTTKDFLICASPDTYPESFGTNSSLMSSILMVWARRERVYNGSGYTYRIETLGDIEPEEAFAVWSYELNQIVRVKQYQFPEVQELKKEVWLEYRGGNTLIHRQGQDQKIRPTINRDDIRLNQPKRLGTASRKFSDLDFKLRSNRWSSPNHSIFIPANYYAYVKSHISFWAIFLLCLLVCILCCCIGMCLYAYQLYRKFMGLDKKPRLRTNSYVETVKSGSSVIHDEEFTENMFGSEEEEEKTKD